MSDTEASDRAAACRAAPGAATVAAMDRLPNGQETRPGHGMLLDAQPYWVMGKPCAGGAEFKRYYHAPAHVPDGASGLIREFARVNGLPPAMFGQTIETWGELENAPIQAFSAGAVQIRRSARQEGGFEAKAYFKPARTDGAGLHPATVVLGRAAAKVDPAAEAHVRREMLRRDRYRSLFYVSAALRPGLEIETYFDCEGSAEPFSPESLRDLAMHVFGMPEMAERAALAAGEALRRGFLCDHVSCNLWPADSREISVALSVGGAVKREVRHTRTRRIHLDLIRELALMAGTDTPVPRNESDVTIFPGLEPSVVSVKIADVGGEVTHSILFEEIDPSFPSLI